MGTALERHVMTTEALGRVGDEDNRSSRDGRLKWGSLRAANSDAKPHQAVREHALFLARTRGKKQDRGEGEKGVLSDFKTYLFINYTCN